MKNKETTMRLTRETAEAIVDGELDLFDVLNGDADVSDSDFESVQDLFETVAADNDLDAEDDFEEILDIMLEKIESVFSGYGESV